MPDIFEEILRIRRERINAAIATVVEGASKSPGRTGFRMIVYQDGKISGTVGGGLLEAKVREKALRCLQDKRSELLDFILDETNANGIGMLCGGKVKVFIEPIIPTRTLYVFGGGHIAVPLVQFAKVLEFEVVVVDDRKDFANKERFPLADNVELGDFVALTRSIDFNQDDCVVIITHGHEHDGAVLKECLAKGKLPGYVGMIGSRPKIAKTFADLKQQGISEELLRRVKAPVGLDIGGRTPAEIAISIMAQIIAHIYGKIAEDSIARKIDSSS